jgi:hypothetical protein
VIGMQAPDGQARIHHVNRMAQPLRLRGEMRMAEKTPDKMRHFELSNRKADQTVTGVTAGGHIKAQITREQSQPRVNRPSHSGSPATAAMTSLRRRSYTAINDHSLAAPRQTPCRQSDQ